MSNWTVDEALKWADTWGPTDGEPPTGDQLALATLSRALRAAGAELASMRQQFEAADRERSELRADAERYRWLRDPKNAYHDAWNYFSPSGSAAEMDAAIDAAILGARETLRTAALEKDGSATAPPIWETLAEIGESAPAGTWDALPAEKLQGQHQ